MYKCDWCSKDNFSFDGRHMTCKNCGQVLIRSPKKEESKERKLLREYRAEFILTGDLLNHYIRMKDFDGVLR